MYCINPQCLDRINSEDSLNCQSCNTPLTINNRFKLDKPIRVLQGQPGTEVFEAVDTTGSYISRPGTRVILKVLNSRQEKLIEAIQKEADVLQRLDHPCIPKVDLDDYFTCRPESLFYDLHCLCLSKIEGDDLDSWIQKNGKIKQDKAIQWLKQISELLEEIHGQNFFHRDIKPSNIIVCKDEKLCLIDFGSVCEISSEYLARISKISRSDTTEDLFITSFRTPFFTPIEQINGRAVPQSDFYSLGKTFVYLLTGKYLNEISAKNDDFMNLVWRPYARQIEKPLADFIDKLQAPDVTKRPRNCQEILSEINTLPQRIKRHRLTKSWWIRALALTSIVGMIIAGANAISSQWSRSLLYDALDEVDKGDLKDAQKKLEFAIRIDPENFDAYNNLASLCLKTENIGCAFDNYNESIKYAPKPKEWVPSYNLGRMYDKIEDYSKARYFYNQSIQLSDETNILPVNGVARLYLLEGNPDQAKHYLLPLLVKSSNASSKINILKNLGWAELQNNRLMQAEIYLKNAISIQDKNDIISDKTISPADPYCLLYEVQTKSKIPNPKIRESCLLLDTNVPEIHELKLKFINQ